MVSDPLRVGVLGAGVMGSGIAQVTATAGCPTVCYDIDADALERGRSLVTTGRYGLARGVERGKLTQDQADAALGRLRFTGDFDEAADVDLVIEAVPERLALKVAVFRQLDRVAPPEAILASNTSGFPIAALAAATDRPGSVIGWHWASPAPVMRFAEIVRTRDTAEETVTTVADVARRCGKSPVVIRDVDTAWGFVANRVYAAMLVEARRVVDEGVATAKEVDELMRDCFGWPTGPFGMVQGATGGWS
jgi:3-hydroxybutyryl-CoA dehydrogenase